MFIISLMTIMPHLNIFLIIFLSSIWIRGRSFWKAHVKMAYIQFQLPRRKSSLLSSQHRSIGSHLGHPSFHVVENLVKSNNLPCSSESSSQSICDACQQAKGHQLPYPMSTSVSSKPRQLIFSDVWGPAPDSVGRKKYYVSFIDEFSKFT
jgi:hypothetical protein